MLRWTHSDVMAQVKAHQTIGGNPLRNRDVRTLGRRIGVFSRVC